MSRRVVLLAVFGLAGCGEGVKKIPLPETVPVSGTVTLDGDAIGSAVVRFIPSGGTKGVDCQGVTDDSGAYTLKQLRGGDGAPPGDYTVVISLLKRGDGTPVVPGAEGENKEGEGGIAIESLPPRYSNLANSTLKATVPDDGGEFPFELKSK